MLQALCHDVAQWNAVTPERMKLSLNVSPHYLDRGGFVEKLQAALQDYRIAPTQIEIEITENICIRNPQHAAEQLHKLGQLGVSVAIDDFGTGYSSLSYLHRFPVNTIKIDQSFIREIREPDGHYPVVLAIISIAKGLGLNVVAEGVETPAQAAYLEQSGCTLMQGYLYHRPLSGAHFLQIVRRNAARRA
jgi:EAL domain-containing protein (putative c-di-GMP-specific phosphodiesterase class I)